MFCSALCVAADSSMALTCVTVLFLCLSICTADSPPIIDWFIAFNAFTGANISPAKK